jgi:hypothetical protein
MQSEPTYGFSTQKAYAAFVKNGRFKQTIDLLGMPTQPRLKVVE